MNSGPYVFVPCAGGCVLFSQKMSPSLAGLALALACVGMVVVEPPVQVYGQVDFNSSAVAGASSTSLSTAASGLVVTFFGANCVGDTGFNRVICFGTAMGDDPTTFTYGQAGSKTSSGANVGGVSATTLSAPTGVYYTSGNKGLFVADTGNNRALCFPVQGNTANVVLGQSGSFASNTANKGGISSDSMNAPRGIVVDPMDNVYVADTGNNRVLFYQKGVMTGAQRVYGQANFSVGDPPGTASALTLSGPTGLALDSRLNLYVCDTNCNRVLKYVTPSAAASFVLGQPGMTTCTAGVGPSSLSGPQAVAISPNGESSIERHCVEQTMLRRCLDR